MFHKGFQDYRNIFGFYADAVKHNGVYSKANRVVKYARGYFLISTIIKYMSIIIAFIETSAILVALSTLLLIIIPIFVVTVAVFTLFGLSQYKTFDKDLAPIFEEKEKIMFLFSSRGWSNKHSAFLRAMARDFKNDGYTVFVVSRPLIRGGLNSAEKIEEDLWNVKLNYFYLMKRKYLKKIDKNKLTYVS